MPEIIATSMPTAKAVSELSLGGYALASRLGSDERFEVSEVIRWDQRLEHRLSPS